MSKTSTPFPSALVMIKQALEQVFVEEMMALH